MTRRRLAVLVMVVPAVAFLAVRFIHAAGNRARAMRAEACRALSPQTMVAAKVKPGDEAPDFSLKDASGKTRTLRELRGRPVLLNFWATWCPPCVEEMPSLENLSRRAGDRLAVLTVSLDEDWETVKKFFPRGTSLSIVLDSEKEVPKRYGTEKYPETFLIDSAGKLQHLFYQAKWDSAEAALCLESLK
jgi:cytochrome c biogenesis protein CcmG, thiol:disulfide interchange protein DsbE